MALTFLTVAALSFSSGCPVNVLTLSLFLKFLLPWFEWQGMTFLRLWVGSFIQWEARVGSEEGRWQWCFPSFLFFLLIFMAFMAAPGGAGGKESACQCTKQKTRGFDSWFQKNPWRRAWQSTPVFLAGKSHGQRNHGLPSIGSQTVRHDWSNLAHMPAWHHLFPSSDFCQAAPLPMVPAPSG